MQKPPSNRGGTWWQPMEASNLLYYLTRSRKQVYIGYQVPTASDAQANWQAFWISTLGNGLSLWTSHDPQPHIEQVIQGWSLVLFWVKCSLTNVYRAVTWAAPKGREIRKGFIKNEMPGLGRKKFTSSSQVVAWWYRSSRQRTTTTVSLPIPGRHINYSGINTNVINP